MSFRRNCIKKINSFVSLVVVLLLIIFGSYSVYALWDNQQIYNAAQDVQLEMQRLKPEIDEESEEGPSFAELLAINPDVRAWLTMDGTGIDYPVLQGETNLSYINTDVYGKFALAGSLFLDCRNSPDFSDGYNLIYGHHMANSLMFGDLDLYKSEKFFRENTTGVLITKNGVYDLRVCALLIVPASEENIFEVPQNQDTDKVISYVRENAVFLNRNMPEQGDTTKLLALTTCSSDFTDARTIVITTMHLRSHTALIGGDTE